jgi:hypothetical protein
LLNVPWDLLNVPWDLLNVPWDLLNVPWDLLNVPWDLLNVPLQVMQANDQLLREMAKGRVFVGFEEAPLDFPPTYKFDKMSDLYDSSSKQRVPSWTVSQQIKSNNDCRNNHKKTSYLVLHKMKQNHQNKYNVQCNKDKNRSKYTQ